MAQARSPLKANASGTLPFRQIDSTDRLPYLPSATRVYAIDRNRRREAHLPAQQARPQASAWLPLTHGDRRRPSSAGRTAGKGAQTTVGLSPVAEPLAQEAAEAPGRLARLKTRTEFLRVAASRHKAVTPGLILQAAPRPTGTGGYGARVGYTASRKVGNAVVRNRAKRRLRAVAGQLLAREGRPLTDYVLIARQLTALRPFTALLGDLETALRQVGRSAQRHRPRTGDSGPVPKE